MSLPDSWGEAYLDTVCLLNPKLAFDERPEGDTEVTFVPMSAVDEVAGVVAKPEVRSYDEVSKGYTSFKDRDVLFAKVTPCMENGKAAIADSLLNGLGFGSTEFHVLRPTDAVLPEYLFHFIRQPAFRKRAASAFVGSGGLQRVPPDFLARVKLPLPTLPEQHRIVDVLSQAEAVIKLHKQLDDLLVRAKQQLYVEMFGDPNPKENSTWPIIKLGNVVTIATGGTPSREQLDSYGGAVAWVKSTDLTDESILHTGERLTELGIRRSNAKVFPKNTVLLAMYGQGQTRGRTGKLLIEAACNQACAALLPSEELLPDYLWTWFQLSYEAVRALGRGGQQENLNLDIVRNIKLPKPPLQLQKEFARRLRQLLEIVNVSQRAKRQTEILLAAVRVEALSGGTTSTWREQHREEILSAATMRNEVLRKRGERTRSSVVNISVPITSAAQAYVEHTREHITPARSWLIGELSKVQRSVYDGFLSYQKDGVKPPLLAEDREIFSAFCSSEQMRKQLKGVSCSDNNIRRVLGQLAAFGLIIKIALPKTNEQTREREFLLAFRPLREEDQTRHLDMEAIKKSLSHEVYYFESILDYETSERAGAGGMFQVIQLSDDKGRDRSDLVDQGWHYSSLDELAKDIAKAIDVDVRQIDLHEV